MSIFSTAFRVSNSLNIPSFVAEGIAWLRGMDDSIVFDQKFKTRMDGDDWYFEAPNGETLSFLTYKGQDEFAVGIKHRRVDEQRRIWRSEAILSFEDGQTWVTARCQCIVPDVGVPSITPKRPHIVRQLVEAGHAQVDGDLTISAEPKFLDSNPMGLDLARKLILGESQNYLPIIFVSRDDENNVPIDVDRLSSRLAGVAHVVVEPDRAFSFELMEATKGMNPYGGALGFITNKSGEVWRLLPTAGKRFHFQSVSTKVEETVSARRHNLAWDWSRLQERQTLSLKERIKNGSNDKLNEYMAAFDEELEDKSERISELENRLAEMES